MASVTKGYTFGSTEEVTAAKLHTLVDSATVGSIVAADISDGVITDTQIQSVGGAKLTTLTAIPAGAGVIPAANLTSVAQKGANSDITSLTGLTTPIDETMGGTGQTTITQGDILYGSAANTLSKLGAGTSGQFLQTQGAGANPQWATPQTTGFYGGLLAITGTGDNVISGVGFQPSFIVIHLYDLGTKKIVSTGFFDGTNNKCTYVNDNNGTVSQTTSYSFYYWNATNQKSYGTISAVGADGFTLSVASKATGNLDFTYYCYK